VNRCSQNPVHRDRPLPHRQCPSALYGTDHHRAGARGPARRRKKMPHPAALFAPVHRTHQAADAAGDMLRGSWEQASDLCQDQLGAIAILDVGALDHHQQQQAKRVDEDVAFASVDLFAGIIPALPTLPCAVVLTAWESMIAADGVLARPSVWRTCSRHVVLIWVNKAVSRHWQKETYTVCHARKLCGNSRHAHPARNKERIALRISRQSTPHRMQRGSWFLPVICSISQFFLKCLQVSGSCAVAVARLLTPDTIRQIVQSGLRVALLLTPAGRLRDRVQ